MYQHPLSFSKPETLLKLFMVTLVAPFRKEKKHFGNSTGWYALLPWFLSHILPAVIIGRWYVGSCVDGLEGAIRVSARHGMDDAHHWWSIKPGNSLTTRKTLWIQWTEQIWSIRYHAMTAILYPLEKHHNNSEWSYLDTEKLIVSGLEILKDVQAYKSDLP